MLAHRLSLVLHGRGGGRPACGEIVKVDRSWWGFRAQVSELRINLLAIPQEEVRLLVEVVDGLLDVRLGDEVLDVFLCGRLLHLGEELEDDVALVLAFNEANGAC